MKFVFLVFVLFTSSIVVVDEICAKNVTYCNDRDFVACQNATVESVIEISSLKTSSIAFVFDTTGSMADDLTKAQMGASKILQKILNNNSTVIYNFVFVPFNDPDVGPVTVTRNVKEFIGLFDHIRVYGGGECPEMTLSGIQKALIQSQPYSYIYVFTDASAKDEYLLNDILSLIQSKHSQVVFILTGSCDENVVNYAFEGIATISSGQIFHLEKSDVDKVVKSVALPLKSIQVNLLSVDSNEIHTLGNPGKYNIVIDAALEEFRLSISGRYPTIALTDPSGRYIDCPPYIELLLELQNAKIIAVKEPKQGEWKIEITSGSKYTLRVTGFSNISFEYGFSYIPILDMKKASHRPILGIPSYVLVKPVVNGITLNLTECDVLKMDGTIVDSFELVQRGPSLYVAQFIPFENLFYLRVSGIGNDNSTLRRMSTTAITPFTKDPLLIDLPTKIEGRMGDDTTIKCAVQSLLKFTVTWIKDDTVLKEDNFVQPSKSVLIVKNITYNTEGYYTCQVTTSTTTELKQVYLSVNGPAPVIHNEEKVFARIGKSVHLICNVRSLLPYNITWKIPNMLRHDRSNATSSVGTFSKTNVKTKNSYIIDYVTFKDEGWYECNAENKGGSSSGKIYLAVQEAPAIQIYPKLITFVNHDDISICCRLIAGYPKPSIVWKRGSLLLEELNDRRITIYETRTDLCFKITKSVESDEGVYECEASNEVDVVSNNSTVCHEDRPSIKTDDTAYCAVGDAATLKCNVTGSSKYKIRWNKSYIHPITNSTFKYKVFPDGRLYIRNASFEDDGYYICHVENALGAASAGTTLKIGHKPKFTMDYTNVTEFAVADGNFVYLNCSIGYNTTWFVNGTILTDRNVPEPEMCSHIHILCVKDPGLYKCVITNEFGSAEVQFRVSRIEYPCIIKMSDILWVNIGDKVMLTCQVVNHDQPFHRKWITTNGTIVYDSYKGNNLQVNENGTLVIEEMKNDLEGKYECIVSNVAGSVNQVIDLRVSRNVIRYNYNVSIFEEEDYVMVCDEGNVTWTFNSTEPSYSGEDSGVVILEDQSLLIYNSDVNLTGVYECKVVTNESIIKILCYFLQVCPQISNLSIPLINVLETDNALLTCPNTDHKSYVQWLKDDKPLDFVPNERADASHLILLKNGTSLKVIESRTTDHGRYSCFVINQTTIKQYDMMLHVLQPPFFDDLETYKFITAPENTSVVLDCPALGFPVPKIIWKKSGFKIPLNKWTRLTGLEFNDQKLIISNISRLHTGIYICKAKNKISYEEKFFNLNIV